MPRRATAVPAALLAALAVLLALAGCAQPTPEQRVAATRAQYRVQRFSFLVQKPRATPAPQVVAADEAGAAEVPAGEVPEAEPADALAADATATADAPEAGPLPVDVLFDVVLSFSGDAALPGITLDVTHADAQEQEKGTHRQYVETADMVDGAVKQVAFTLEGLPFEEGDGFAVEVRSHVPEGERDAYREYAEAGTEAGS